MVFYRPCSTVRKGQRPRLSRVVRGLLCLVALLPVIESEVFCKVSTQMQVCTSTTRYMSGPLLALICGTNIYTGNSAPNERKTFNIEQGCLNGLETPCQCGKSSNAWKIATVLQVFISLLLLVFQFKILHTQRIEWYN